MRPPVSPCRWQTSAGTLVLPPIRSPAWQGPAGPLERGWDEQGYPVTERPLLHPYPWGSLSGGNSAGPIPVNLPLEQGQVTAENGEGY